jgi:protein MpaA
MKYRNMTCRLALAGILGTLLTATGCHLPRTRVIGESVQGRAIEVHTLGAGPSTVLMIATIHGNEPAGTPLVEKLQEHLLWHPGLLADRTVVIVPVANPDGRAADTRGNIRGVDLNRNFPAANYAGSRRHGREPLSQPESQTLYDLLHEVKPDWIVSIHQPLACIDFDGPAVELAQAMAAHTDLPVKKLGSRAGSLGSYAGVELGIPIVTLELPRDATGLSPDELWTRYGESLLAAVRFEPPGAIEMPQDATYDNAGTAR